MADAGPYRERMARVVVDLNNQLADSQSGSLIQIWMPDRVEGSNRLQTQGLPYAVTGSGDLLALFRCISCRYTFSIDVMQPKLLGCPGRVYTTLDPEMCNDLQKYNKQVYLRVNEAQRCRVHSTLVVPLFDTPARERPLGVLEVVKSAKNVAFSELIERITTALHQVDLYSSDVDGRNLEIGLRKWVLDVDNSLMDVSAKPQIEELDGDGEEVSGKGDNSSEEPPAKALRRSSQGKGSLSPDMGNAATSKPDKETSKEIRLDKHRLTAQSALGMSGSAPNLTTLSGHQDASRSSGDASVSVSSVSGVVPGAQYRMPTMFMSANADAPMCYPNDVQHTGMNYIAVTNMQGGVPMMPRFDASGGEVPMVQQVGVPMNPTTSQTYGPVNASQDMANAMMHIQNFQSLLQELQPGSRKSRHDRKMKTNMGTGRHLTFEDLKRHMNVGLKEAAVQLGICPTTLKRACRRNGITRWPCRQLAKLNKTMSDLGRRGPPPGSVLDSAFRGQLKTSSLTKELSAAEFTAAAVKGGDTTQGVDIHQVSRELPGPSSAPACLDLLAEADGHLLGSSSSQGLLSTGIGEQDYEWTTTGDDADDALRPADEDDAEPSRSAGQSGGTAGGSSSHDGRSPVPQPAMAAAAAGDIAHPAATLEPCGMAQLGSASFKSTGTAGSDSGPLPIQSEGGPCLADLLRDSFDISEFGRLDIDSDMPDLSELCGGS